MLKRAGKLALALASVAMFMVWMASFSTSIAIARRARSRGVDIIDLFFYADTFYSHQLLPDGNLAIDLDDVARQEADLQRIQRLFSNPDERKLVLEWGRQLFEAARQKHFATEPVAQNMKSAPSVSAHQLLREMRVSDALAAHAAWRRLTAAAGSREADLFDLRAVVEREAGDAEHLHRLLDWGKRRGRQKDVLRVLPGSNVKLAVRPHPPDLEWFSYFAVYEDWCITGPLFDARREELLSRFDAQKKGAAHVWNALLGIGEQALAERAKLDDSRLPDPSERAKVVAAVDRISGLEPGRRRRLEAEARFLLPDVILLGHAFQPSRDGVYDYGPPQLSFIVDAAPRAKPLAILNDGVYARDYRHWREYNQVDVLPFVPYALISSTLSLGTAIPADPRPVRDESVALYIGFCIILFYLAATYGHRLLLVRLPGVLPNVRRLEPYGKLTRDFWRYLYVKWITVPTAQLLLSFVELALKPLSGNEDILFASSVAEPLLGKLAAALWGSVITDVFDELLQMGFIIAGRDPDERPQDFISSRLFGVVCMAALLRYFQNDWQSVFNSAASGFLDPGFWRAVGKLSHAGRSRPSTLPSYRMWELAVLGLGGLLLVSGPFGALFKPIRPAWGGEVEIAGSPPDHATPRVEVVSLSDFVSKNRAAIKAERGYYWVQTNLPLERDNPILPIVDQKGRASGLAISGKPWFTWDNEVPVYVFWGEAGKPGKPLSTWAVEYGDYDTSNSMAKRISLDPDAPLELLSALNTERLPFIRAASALHLAAVRGDVPRAKELLSKKPDLEQRGDKQVTALHLAAAMGHKDMVSLLLERGATLDPIDADGRTPLGLAAELGQLETMDLLLERGAAMAPAVGLSALSAAARGGHVEAVKRLLAHGASPAEKPKNVSLPLLSAARRGHADVVALLLASGAHPDDLSGTPPVSPLMGAADHGHGEVVEALLAKGAKPDTVDKDGLSALHFAARRGQAESVEHLLKHGANPNLQTKAGETPLHIAIDGWHMDVARVLVTHGANLNLKAKATGTPLEAARAEQHFGLMALLEGGMRVGSGRVP